MSQFTLYGYIYVITLFDIFHFKDGLFIYMIGCNVFCMYLPLFTYVNVTVLYCTAKPFNFFQILKVFNVRHLCFSKILSGLFSCLFSLLYELFDLASNIIKLFCFKIQ